MLVVVLVPMLGACASGGPRLFEMSADTLYQRGMAALNDEDWSEAIRYFDQIVTRFPTDRRIQEVRYHLGEAYFGNDEYLTAASEFVRLATDYPSGEYADDARFMACDAYYRLSPDPELDQEYTRAAIDHCSALSTYFPASEFAPKAQERVRDLYEKLAMKLYLNGDYYYKRHAYDSSIIYFEDVLDQFPNTRAAPRALLRLIQVYRRLGYREEMEAARERLVSQYPDSEEAREAREISLAGGR